MTELELAQVWRFHHPRVSIATGPSVCNADSQVWPCDAHKLRAEVERLRGVVEAALRVRRSPDAFSGRSHWRRHYIEGVEAPVEHTLYRDCGLCTVLNRAALEEGE